MIIKVFQADKGDCLLIEGRDGKNILVDGGMSFSYRDQVASTMNKIHQDGKKLSLVCVSHIDQDHIGGILEMLDNLVDWRVHDFKIGRGQRHRTPKSKRPPEIEEIWHNAFGEQVGVLDGPVETLLASFSEIFSGDQPPDIAERGELITSIKEAILLSRRIDAKQLNIPLNKNFDKLVLRKEAPVQANIGNMKIRVIAPTKKQLEDLIKEWKEWLQDNRDVLKEIRFKARTEERRFISDLDRFIQPMLIQARELGNIKKVTTPNLASIMFLLEENGKRVLMTGDGHGKHILEGLEAAEELSNDGNIHLDVLKIQHHGSEHNIDADFCKAVTADHYIFCGNGAHENPDLNVVEVLIRSRMGNKKERSTHPKCKNHFTLWFNSSSRVTREKYREHMKKVEHLVRRYARRRSRQLSARFIRSAKGVHQLNI